MLRQEKRGKEVRLGSLARSPRTRRGGGETPSSQAPVTAHANIQDSSPFQTRQFPGRSKKGDGGPTVPLNRTPPPPCLPTFSEFPCHRTSSSWKLPLGSAPRMPNSISQGACQQPGWGLRHRAAARGAGTQLCHGPRRGSGSAAARCPGARGHILPDPGRRNPAEAASGRHPTERGRDATTPADSINYHCQEIRNRSKRLMYSFRELPQASGRPQGSLARGGTSPLKFQGSYFPSVLGDTSVFSSLLVIRLRHRTCRGPPGG
ncbi:uncharacterized protein LOC118668239 isoform X2 [Myotis myotis]|uniref:uncharacterized protein LOC118668239 isoform X2 n=1 Tax=Myotis myotis TaxID=51298 RepID=UPI00174C9A8A|nr:uncharacterized protein LOC118668239 isoform X2 [Myotis myotis]